MDYYIVTNYFLFLKLVFNRGFFSSVKTLTYSMNIKEKSFVFFFN